MQTGIINGLIDASMEVRSFDITKRNDIKCEIKNIKKVTLKILIII